MFCSNCGLSIILPHKYHCICGKGKFSLLYNHSSGLSAGKYCTMAYGPGHAIKYPHPPRLRLGEILGGGRGGVSSSVL